VLLHGFTRRAYAWAKALSVAGSAFLVSGLGFLCFLFAARLRFPPSIWTRPLLPDLVVVAFLAWIAGGTALMGFVASSLTRNEYVAALTPFLVLTACAFLFHSSALSPTPHVDAWHSVAMGRSAIYFTTPGEFLYWLVLGALLAATGSELYARRQGD
jgi:ABC-type transport system involved in multi-copper enzyme maturation permease subunit